jgi:hypothetical protein
LVYASTALFPEQVFQERPRIGWLLIWFGHAAKLALLALGAVVAWGNAKAFAQKTPARAAWTQLALGQVFYGCGQALLAAAVLWPDQLGSFPSPADLFFLAGYPFFIAAVIVFAVAYQRSGYPVASKRESWLFCIAGVAVSAVLAVPLLLPIVRSAAPALEKALNLGYPALDFILLIPTALLLRMAWRLRGGLLGSVWGNLAGGFVFICAGDIVFGYMTAFDLGYLRYLAGGLFLVGYGLVTAGCLHQRRLT